MRRLEVAAQRFNAALETLLQSAEPLSNPQQTTDETTARLAALTEERERLLARIAELEKEARMLSGASEQVESRLDSAIAEIRTALGR
jgi:chromosome segregation ATPase